MMPTGFVFEVVWVPKEANGPHGALPHKDRDSLRIGQSLG
jgi:hypothetical protein